MVLLFLLQHGPQLREAELIGRTDGRLTDGRTGGRAGGRPRADGRTDGRTCGRIDGRTRAWLTASGSTYLALLLLHHRRRQPFHHCRRRQLHRHRCRAAASGRRPTHRCSYLSRWFVGGSGRLLRGIDSLVATTGFVCRPERTTPLFRRRNDSRPCAAACGDGVAVVSRSTDRRNVPFTSIYTNSRVGTRVNSHTSVG